MLIKLLRALSIFFLLLVIFALGNYFLADFSFSSGYKSNLSGNFEDSANKISQAINLNDNEPTYFRELADSYCMLGESELCLEAASQALNINSNNSLTLKALIKTFLRSGLNENALILSEKLVDLCPEDLEAQYLLDFARQNGSGRKVL
jgi:tetratricopeptide (TPR) repeat protein